MDDDSKHMIQNWGDYYRSPPMKGNLGLQLMSSIKERGITDPSAMPMDFIWYNNNSNSNSNRDSSKMVHLFQDNHHEHLLPETSAHSFQMLQQLEAPNAEPTKKRSKKSKKAKATKEESFNPCGRGRSVKKSMDMVINGIDLDISGIPTPVCTCTGQSQQCYKWGVGGWQSACCTSSISLHPLPMSSKRRGARIAGRKMSQGAFKKVLENLAGEGEDFSSPIDLKPFWAKHGTNKFVTIR